MFFLCKILHQPGFDVQDGLMHGLMALTALGLDEDPLAPAVIGIGGELDEAFLLQSGQKTRNCGMGQLKFRFQIPGAGCFLGMGQIGHNPTLGSGQLHFLQFRRHGLVGTPVEDPDEMSQVILQNDHLL